MLLVCTIMLFAMFENGVAGPPQKSKSMGVVRQPQVRRTQRIKSDGNLNSAVVPSSRRRVPGSGGGHASDSELA